jgi:trehalose-6-phosphatase
MMVNVSPSDLSEADTERKLFMRLWIFDFDGTTATEAIDQTITQLDPACEARLRILSESPSDQVVIISNRNIYDIAERIKIPGVIIGGCNGIEWQLPSGYRIGPFRDLEDDLIRCRLKILPELSKIVYEAGLEMDDKLWSIAVDSSHLKYNQWINLEYKICTWSRKYSLTVSSLLDRIDIQLIPGFNKSVGISYLARMFKIDPSFDSIIYAGDDECDVVALWWTVLFGGTAIMVGNDLQVPEANYVRDSSALITMIDDIVKIP